MISILGYTQNNESFAMIKINVGGYWFKPIPAFLFPYFKTLLRTLLRNFPVYDEESLTTSSGVPVVTT